jgi:hypothetical protein
MFKYWSNFRNAVRYSLFTEWGTIILEKYICWQERRQILPRTEVDITECRNAYHQNQFSITVDEKIEKQWFTTYEVSLRAETRTRSPWKAGEERDKCSASDNLSTLFHKLIRDPTQLRTTEAWISVATRCGLPLSGRQAGRPVGLLTAEIRLVTACPLSSLLYAHCGLMVVHTECHSITLHMKFTRQAGNTLQLHRKAVFKGCPTIQ